MRHLVWLLLGAVVMVSTFFGYPEQHATLILAWLTLCAITFRRNRG